MFGISKILIVYIAMVGCFLAVIAGCGTFSRGYHLAKGTLSSTYHIAKFATGTTYGTAKLTYKLGKVTFDVLSAPLDWPMTHDIEEIGGLSPKEAVRLGKVKKSPYTVRGQRYQPMTISQANRYKQTGLASWYGEETRRQKGGHMTANGEVFDPDKSTAAHKYLPLPYHVRVTNLENGRSMLLRVNDRGPFVKGRIIDLSAGAAKKLGFYRKGTARVLVEAVSV